MITRFLIILGLAAVGWCQDCTFVNKLNCTTYADGIECGSDGVDYLNRCFFAKAHCLNPSLNIHSMGPCANSGYTVTPVTPVTSFTQSATVTPFVTKEPLFQGHNAVQDFLCLELMHEDCPMDTEMVCGSDNNTYDNFCEFQKQRCSHRDLTVNHYGPC